MPTIDGALPARERERHLRPAVSKVQVQRNQREPPLTHLATETVDLAPVEQQLPIAGRLRVLPGRLLVRRDVDAAQEDLAPPDPGIAVGQRGTTCPKRLDLRPEERDPGLDRLLDVVAVSSLAVRADELARRLTLDGGRDPPRRYRTGLR